MAINRIRRVLSIAKIKEKVKTYVTGAEPVTNQTNYMVAAMLSATIAAATAYATGTGQLETLVVFFTLFVISVLLRGHETDKNIDRDSQKLENQLRSELNELKVMKERVDSPVYSTDVDKTSDGTRSEPSRSGTSSEPDNDSDGSIIGDSSGNPDADSGRRTSEFGVEPMDRYASRKDDLAP